MKFFSTLAAAAALTFGAVSAQDLSAANNITSLFGTWSSGSGGVQTGFGFANPVNYSFIYPKTTGISYSFTDDGFFEEAQYRFVANASLPNCIKAIVFYQHGKYALETNGSIILTPFSADGRIQVQDPCAAKTNIITTYDQTTLYSSWTIQIDTLKNNYALQLAKFDGAPMMPMYLVARPPNMLPTTQLTGYVGNSTELKKRDTLSSFRKRSAGSPSFSSTSSLVTLAGSAFGLVTLGFFI